MYTHTHTHTYMLSVCVCVLSHVQHFFANLRTKTTCSSVHRIFQARILEWVAISYSGGSSQSRD